MSVEVTSNKLMPMWDVHSRILQMAGNPPTGLMMRYLHRNEWIAYGLLVAAVLAVSLPLYPYRWHMFLHISGAVVFLGNIVVTAAWMLMAERTRSISVIHFSAKAVVRADFLFTLPGVLLILVNGLVMVFAVWGGRDTLYSLSWISSALALFTASGVIWLSVLIPVQHRMVVFSDPAEYPDSLPRQFFSALHKWYLWGGLAIALPIGSLYLMVNKPAFG